MDLELQSELDLYEDNQYFYFVSLQNDETPDADDVDAVEINKHSKEIQETKIQKKLLKKDEGYLRVYGILGFIKLVKSIFTMLQAFYIIVATKRNFVGKLLRHDIYSLAGIKILSCDTSVRDYRAEEMDKYYVKMIYEHFNTPGFYFCYTLDLTRRMEKCLDEAYQCYTSLFEFNYNFMWNRHLLSSVIHMKSIYQYFLPVIHGYVGVADFGSSSPLGLVLISRRSNLRVGTRYFVRGADLKGNTANYVETETIIVRDNQIMSFVQVRGSIPLCWTQYPNLKYKPKLYIDSQVNQLVPLMRHLEKELHERGCEIILNLVDDKSDEKLISNAFAKNIQRLNLNSSKLQYFHFDFHKNCSKMRFENINILLDKLENIRTKLGYFHANLPSISNNTNHETIITKQSGVFRTNCMDCLDRTNVVQSMLSWRTILSFFATDNGIPQNIENIPRILIERQHKLLWANNADNLSIQYAATPALKTDFTRTGVRTFKGVLNDGVNSLMRYFYNNFNDGYRQDSLDLVCGNYKRNTILSESYPKVQKSIFSAILPISLLTLFIILCGDIFLLSDSLKLRFGVGLIDIMAIFFIARYIFKHPFNYVNMPLLISLNNQEKYKPKL